MSDLSKYNQIWHLGCQMNEWFIKVQPDMTSWISDEWVIYQSTTRYDILDIRWMSDLSKYNQIWHLGCQMNEWFSKVQPDMTSWMSGEWVIYQSTTRYDILDVRWMSDLSKYNQIWHLGYQMNEWFIKVQPDMTSWISDEWVIYQSTTRYDILDVRWMSDLAKYNQIWHLGYQVNEWFIKVWTDCNFILFHWWLYEWFWTMFGLNLIYDITSLLFNFSCEFEQIVTGFEFLEVMWVILSNVRSNWNFTYFYFWWNLYMWTGGN